MYVSSVLGTQAKGTELRLGQGRARAEVVVVEQPFCSTGALHLPAEACISPGPLRSRHLSSVRQDFIRTNTKRKWGGSQARLGEPSDHGAHLTPARLGGSILACLQ